MFRFKRREIYNQIEIYIEWKSRYSKCLTTTEQNIREFAKFVKAENTQEVRYVDIQDYLKNVVWEKNGHYQRITMIRDIRNFLQFCERRNRYNLKKPERIEGIELLL